MTTTSVVTRLAAPSVQRNVALTGSAAREWLDARGWASTDTPELRVFGDVFDALEWSASRLWLGTGVHERKLSGPKGQVSATLVAEGVAQLEVDGHPGAFTKGGMLVLGTGSHARIDTSGGIALYEVVSDGSRIGLPLLGLGGTAGPFATSEDVWMSLSSLLNQVLGSTLSPSAPSVRAVGRSVDHLVLAALQSCEIASSRGERSAVTLLSLAKSLIASHASAPGFSVMQLAEISNISRAHLYRLFADEDTTPLDHIRSVRAENARNLLVHLVEGDDLALMRVARASGFRSVAAMREALERSVPMALDAPATPAS